MKNISLLTLIVTFSLTCSCVSLRPPTVINEKGIHNYKYIFISPTNSLTSSSGLSYGGQYFSSSKSVNPSDVITGILSKEGLIRLPELKPELTDQTLIVNYGESGRRNVPMGHTIEVTIQFISARSNTVISSCTAEGIGDTEADDIRIAINRCLSSLFSKEK